MTPIRVGQRVRRTKGYPDDVGRKGEVVEVHGTLAGDTLISVRDDATRREWSAYARQVAVIEDVVGDPGWYTGRDGVDLSKLAVAAAHMVRSGRAGEVDRMIEKPWSYADEYQEAIEAEELSNDV